MQLAEMHKVQYDEISQQLARVTKEKATMKEELGEAHEMINHLEMETNRMQEEAMKEKSSNQVMQNLLQTEIQAL